MRSNSHNLITPDLFQPPGRAVARGPLALSALPIHSLRPGAAAPPQPRARPCAFHAPPGRAAEGGGGCLTSATAQPWQVQDGRRRPERTLTFLDNWLSSHPSTFLEKPLFRAARTFTMTRSNSSSALRDLPNRPRPTARRRLEIRFRVSEQALHSLNHSTKNLLKTKQQSIKSNDRAQIRPS
jgi:hypothetical protein